MGFQTPRQTSRTRGLRVEALEDRRLLAVSDFSLPDVNTASTTYDQDLGPHDFEGQVSGWYFGHST